MRKKSPFHDLDKVLNLKINKKHIHLFFILFLLPLLGSIFPLHSTPDLTIVGFVQPEDGLGKVPINIIETLGDRVSANFIPTLSPEIKDPVAPSMIKVLSNPDTSPGKVALLTDLLGDHCRSPYTRIPKDSIIKLAYSMFETTRIPSRWVKILNENFDAVVVPDKSLVNLYQECGVQIPIFALPIPMMLDAYFQHTPHPDSPSNPFVFGDASAYKNSALLTEAFARAFGNNPDVRLVIKGGFILPNTRDDINGLISQFGLTNVSLEIGRIQLNQYMDRLSSFDCLVSLSKGEGFSFIPREALALGIPVIITNNSALTTICNSGWVRAVPTNKKVAPLPHYNELFREDCGNQLDCELEDAIAALRDVYENYEAYIHKAQEGRKWVDQYNSANPELQRQYVTLIKPKQVMLGTENTLQDDVVTTNSFKLFNKYLQIINSNKVVE